MPNIFLQPLPTLMGEDFQASPPFQMVPLGQTRLFRMEGNEDGAWTLTDPTNRVQCDLQGGQRKTQLRLFGRAVGKVRVPWRTERTRSLDTLEIAVMPVREFRVTFRFLATPDGLTSTRRTQADLNAMWSYIRSLVYQQANVILTGGGARMLHFRGTLGRVVDDVPGRASRDMRVLAEHCDPTADVTVFFVRTVDEQSEAGTDELGRYRSELKMIVIEDGGSHSANDILAHEIVHALGAGHEDRRSNLMIRGNNRDVHLTRFLTRDHILAINSGWRVGT